MSVNVGYTPHDIIETIWRPLAKNLDRFVVVGAGDERVREPSASPGQSWTAATAD